MVKGDDVDIQIKDIGYVIAGEENRKRCRSGRADGLAVTAASGNYVLGIALNKTAKDGYCRVQIAKYQKA